MEINILYSSVFFSNIPTRSEWESEKFPVIIRNEMCERVTTFTKPSFQINKEELVGVGSTVDSFQNCEFCSDGLDQPHENSASLTDGCPNRNSVGFTSGGYFEIFKEWRKLFPVLIILISSFSWAQEMKLQPIGEFGKHMAIGLSVNSENRIFVSFPNYDGDGNLALAEWIDGKLVPFPNKNWNTKNAENTFFRVQDIFVDSEDFLWVLDSKPASSGNIFGDGNGEENGQFMLTKIDTKTGKVEITYELPDLDKRKSALNDVRIDLKHNLAYLSDPGLAAIVVMDLKTGKTRVVLGNSEFTKADPIVLKYDGVEMIDKNGKPFSSNVNGIALTKDFNYFYFKPINKKELFRIKTQYLADGSLTEKELESKVEKVANVGITHGLIADKNGNIYLTTSESNSISYVTPNGELKILVQDKRLHWPDSLGIGTDGYLYFSDSQLQKLPQWNSGIDKTNYPYQAFRVALPR